ncbi:LysR family transcriptional regulator [Companilactobacillus sp. FL22-1]|uniref:LysR family transcriptional regulator n=1 Tax=Companilactobacillus sp. FL22-1 TaxID=3373892 RepID=UPI0037541098
MEWLLKKWGKTLDIRKFAVFVDLAKTLNYTETAENLYTTQGNISKQILALEKGLGVTLFKRAHRTIELTPAGRLILPNAKQILGDFDKLTVKLNDFQANQRQTLKIHTIPTMPSYRSFNYISQFLKDYPGIQVQLQEEESYHLIPSLRAGECEIIFARTFEFNHSDLERIVMEDDYFVAVLPQDYPIAVEKLDLAALKSERFLILGEATNLYEPVKQLCEKAGFNPQIVYQGTRVDLIMQMIQNNMGISVMTAKMARPFAEKVKIVPLLTNITNKLSFIRLKGQHSQASEFFWDYIQTKTSNEETE